MKKSKQIKYEIIIGLKDKDTYEQELSTSKFVEIVQSICKNNNIGFSMHVMNGGYIHENGTYVLEKSLNISLIDITREQSFEIADVLKSLFNQESVIVLEEYNNYYLV